MITSKVTQKTYDPADCVFLTNPVQCQRYLEYLGADYLYDILWASEKKKDALVFVFPRCAETRRCKDLWDKHEL